MTQPLARPRLSDSPAFLQLVGDADESIPTVVEPPSQRLPWAWIGLVAAVLAIGALFYVAEFGVTADVRADAATAQLDVTASQAEGLAAQIGKACRDGAIPIPYQGACAAAQDVAVSDLRTVQQTGAAGDRGPAGRDGVDGVNGAPGIPGTPGVDGSDGVDGAVGTAGEDGPPGTTGANGRDGIDGRDGVNGIGIRSSTQDPTDNCYRLVTYDDGRTERWGPFCEPPPTPVPTSTDGAAPAPESGE